MKFPKGTRTLTLRDGVYHWKVGRRNLVVWEPNGEKHVADVDNDVLGLDTSVAENLRENGGLWVLPEDVVDFINRGFRPRREGVSQADEP